ncbi:MAG: GNAT family N-acetyltransferase [Oribacterium sp.]|nr:GNAT family N-acetyltransferase [Oribacterium sp.]
MIIRLMTIEDYEKVYQLWLSCSGMGLNNLDDSKDGIAKYLDRNPDTCFVAEKSDEIIGVIISGHDGRRGFIYHTAVNPEYRNQGIAKMLVEEAMDALKANGINKVALVVFDRNKDGNAFWEKVGFTVREDLVYRNKTISELIRIDT